MAVCPFAIWRPLPQNYTQPKIKARKIILHSAVSNGATTLYHWFSSSGARGAESHFYIRLDGSIEQYIDTAVKANANRYADADAISVETADMGDPDNQPWNDAQIKAIVRLGRWLLETHPAIAPQVVPYPTGAGIGEHQMFMDPATGISPWSNAKFKTCVGRIRREQFPLIALAIASFNVPEEDEMNDLERAMLTEVHSALVEQQYNAQGRSGVKVHNLAYPLLAVNATASRVEALVKQITADRIADAVASRLPEGSGVDAAAVGQAAADEIARRLAE